LYGPPPPILVAPALEVLAICNVTMFQKSERISKNIEFHLHLLKTFKKKLCYDYTKKFMKPCLSERENVKMIHFIINVI
jgi:hypothetical protein